ncbi:neuropeptides capa receptor [Aplysia californica]|uniref:Neuropeptides capa receptor n=1 Tax=Aplysia californica TaxID=6500 RepID=A0ABM0JWQ0_APLCA|nr:neuropeptides capa receptor [Aplysia californica]
MIYGLALNSSCTAVFITLERCLCTVLPLKVKDIITPRRSAFVLGAIFALSMASISPILSVIHLLWKYDPLTNTTVPNTHFASERPMNLIVTNLLVANLQATSFVFLLAATGTLIVTLRSKSKWRQQVSASNQAETLSCRDHRVVKMVVIVSSVLLVCYAPAQSIPLTSMVVPEFHYRRRYSNLYGASWALAYFLYAVNSSVNLVIYYNMSSKYRRTLNELLGKS